MNASDKYRLLRPEEVDEVAARCADAWKDPGIPAAQYELCVKPELREWSLGNSIAPFSALVRCLNAIPDPKVASRTLLDIGASSAYYYEVIKIAGFHYFYTAFDYSDAFMAFAKIIYPGIPYFVGDAHALPFKSDNYDVVVSGSVILHSPRYEQMIAETARVAKSYAVFHRTPVLEGKPTEYWEKEAYGHPVLEVHFGEKELLRLFARHGLKVIYQTDVFWDEKEQFGHRNYLCAKQPLEHHPV